VINVVLDLGNMREARPTLLSQLEALDEEIREEGGSLMLARCSSRILSALQVARLASAIPIFETVAQALDSLPAQSEEDDDPA
jgi:hypothetical protein